MVRSGLLMCAPSSSWDSARNSEFTHGLLECERQSSVITNPQGPWIGLLRDEDEDTGTFDMGFHSDQICLRASLGFPLNRQMHSADIRHIEGRRPFEIRLVHCDAELTRTTALKLVQRNPLSGINGPDGFGGTMLPHFQGIREGVLHQISRRYRDDLGEFVLDREYNFLA